MTLLTPNFAQLQAAKANGGQQHVTAQHEPLSAISQQEATKYNAGFLAPSMPAVVPKEQIVSTNSWMGPKVAIIGTAPSSRMLAPYNDPEWKIWGCSPGNQNALPRFDLWFELHGNLLWPECESYGKPYLDWLSKLQVPVFMQAGIYGNHVPKALPFPKDQLVNEFGPFFFTSSFSWMTAFAIVLGAKEVAMYGIDMASREEYILQRPGGYYFIVEGARRGVKVWAPYESDIMQPPGLYGFSDITQLGRKIHAREQELKQRTAHIDGQLNALQRDSTYLKGALEDVDYFKSIHIGAQDNNTATAFLGNLITKHQMAVGLAVPQPAAPPSTLSPPLTAAVAPTPSKRKPGRPKKRLGPSAETHPAGQG